ncbi:hypothetical protein L1787_05585 [Acuticoccus sp. M5D2P5]|uniref:hypothetical protein n=1 Tax=Acuticoccus kalidii TaxID=2910977 RepID=UPI001F2AFE5B|nr:hypothetical protein [Acuticoccus kalidii]MCF3932885.1 hypothetical protein [Acuticoccus kalidii]
MTNDAEIAALVHAEKVAREALENATKARKTAEWRERDQRVEALKPLAERAHKLLCQWNHTDGCSWGYEESAKDPWSCDAHARWLERFDRLIQGGQASYTARADAPVPVEDITAILDLLEQLSPSERRVFSLLRAGRLNA